MRTGKTWVRAWSSVRSDTFLYGASLYLFSGDKVYTYTTFKPYTSCMYTPGSHYIVYGIILTHMNRLRAYRGGTESCTLIMYTSDYPHDVLHRVRYHRVRITFFIKKNVRLLSMYHQSLNTNYVLYKKKNQNLRIQSHHSTRMLSMYHQSL